MKPSFISSFIKNPVGIGAIAPSSKFLTNEIIRNIDFEKSTKIIELGPGLGTFTKAILEKARDDAGLFCFEVNKEFCDYLVEDIADKRLVIFNTDAEKIGSNLTKYKIRKVDCIVSGLPFRNFSAAKKARVLEEVKSSLKKNGKFILFQYTNALDRMLHFHFGKIEKRFVLRNIPPCFVYTCEK